MVLRIGCVPYMNAYPLWRGLSQVPLFAPPAALYQLMDAGGCDVALLPSLALLKRPQWRAISTVGIASCGPVQSVVLFHRRPLPACRRIGLDPESLTSNALLQILLKEKYKLNLDNLDIINQSIALDLMQPLDTAALDAFLFIGDKALTAELPGWHRLDLAQAWYEWTGLPFVFARWITTAEVARATPALAGDLDAACHRSLACLPSWLGAFAHDHGMTAGALTHYFTKALTFDLTDTHEKGLALFLSLASGLLKSKIR